MGYTNLTFMKALKPYAIRDMIDTGVPASLTGAQGMIESGSGNSGLTVKCNNLFGVKGKYDGRSEKFWTTEYINGVKTRVLADFRKYPSWQESITDHSAFLNKYARYKKVRGCTDYRLAAQYIGESGYATSPTYGSTVLKYMEQFKLGEWDQEALGNIPFTLGTYTTISRLYIRCEQYKESAQVPFSDLTIGAQKHADENGILNKYTRVTVKKITVDKYGNTWGQIPSGWIAIRYNGSIYAVKSL